MQDFFKDIYKDKKVLITGHTGFKGSWLSLWLLDLGAKVAGYSLPSPSNPSHHDLLKLDIESCTGDIRNTESLNRFIQKIKPDILFHLAAQSIVRKSYREPIATLETNIIGTANILEACRQIDSVRAIVNITSDKCYENQEWIWGYRENDRLGGHDPYSASKGCSEIITESYRKSFYPLDEYQKGHRTLVASARAGNVIGGGDWGEDRIIPDIVCATSQNEKVHIRNPHATRPWQHVLEPLSGYLLLGQKLLEGKQQFSGAWNFGPSDDAHITVLSVVENLRKHWPQIDYNISTDNKNPHEANFLKLNCSKAHTNLQWAPVWDSNIIFAETALWYKQYYESGKVISVEQLKEYIKDAKQKQVIWTN
jgi:CDP-glucose 4,6-dehydratase